MGAQSFIYRHLLIYRFIMNILYGGGYKERFNRVIEQMKHSPRGSYILELCFGDTYIAEYCKNNGYRWMGIDLNLEFVEHAKKTGHDAFHLDLSTIDALPKAHVCILMGSLYHFHPDVMSILKKMSDASEVIIISEPVSNLSARKGLIGYLAKRSANVGKGNEAFRYDPQSFMTLIRESCVLLNRKISSFEEYRKDVIIKLIKQNGSD
jgi:hypothetical protein